MLELHAGQTNEQVIVTLSELTTLKQPFYLFVFTHVLTKTVVAFVAGADESDYPERYNQFSFDTAALFSGKPIGEWHYAAYEQESEDNLDPALTASTVEYGKMRLYETNQFEFEQYHQPVTFKAYGG